MEEWNVSLLSFRLFIFVQQLYKVPKVRCNVLKDWGIFLGFFVQPDDYGCRTAEILSVIKAEKITIEKLPERDAVIMKGLRIARKCMNSWD